MVNFPELLVSEVRKEGTLDLLVFSGMFHFRPVLTLLEFLLSCLSFQNRAPFDTAECVIVEEMLDDGISLFCLNSSNDRFLDCFCQCPQ